MALARRDASVPADGARSLGDPDRFADEAYGARDLCLYDDHLVALHGIIKKTRATPDEDLTLARKRHKELVR